MNGCVFAPLASIIIKRLEHVYIIALIYNAWTFIEKSSCASNSIVQWYCVVKIDDCRVLYDKIQPFNVSSIVPAM